MPTRVLLVELGDSHNELLLTQVSALQGADIPFSVVLNDRLRPRLHPDFVRRAGGLSRLRFVGCATPLQRAAAAATVRRRIGAEGISHVVVNTASGNAVQLLSLALPRAVEVTGILHDVSRLETSSRQKVISRRIRHYLVLADHLLPRTPPEGLRFGAFSPIEYPDATPAPPRADLHLVVPGTVNRRRRNYDRLVALAKQRTGAGGGRVVFEILGDITRHDGPDFERMVRSEGLVDRFVFHRDFVPAPAFYSAVAGCHGVLPLLPLEGPSARAYRHLRISGTTVLAYGFRRPLVLHRQWADMEDFALTGIFYDEGGLPSLEQIRAAETRIAAAYRAEPRFDPATQSRRWLDFVLRRC